MSRINKFVLTVSLLIFIMISAVACGIYTQMVKERVYSLKQSVIDTAFAVANIAEYRRSVAIDLINTLNPRTAVGWFAHSLRRLGFPLLFVRCRSLSDFQ